MANIKFVEYTGRYPCLCFGILALNVDGREYVFNGKRVNGKLVELESFGDEKDFDEKGQLKPGLYTRFWSSGGSVTHDKDCNFEVEQDEWNIDEDNLPNELKPYAEEISDIFNQNVTYGCCGGCI